MEIKAKIGLNPCGAYDGTREYSFLDTTESSSGTYMSLKDNNKGHEVTDTTWWECIIDLTGVNKAKDDANTAASNADAATSKANTAATSANNATASANTATQTANTAASNANAATKSATDAAASATAATVPSDYTSGVSEGIAHDEGEADSNRDNYNSGELGDVHADSLDVDVMPTICKQPMVVLGTAAPSQIPDHTGQIYIDTVNSVAYIAVFNSTTANWKQITN